MLATLLAVDVIPQDDGPEPPSGEFADFIAVFPTFAGISEASWDFWHAQALLITEPLQACLGARYQFATWLLTAHYLTLNGLGSGTEAEMAASGASGFRRLKSGTIEIERGDSESDASMGIYGTTAYGRQLWPMLKACLTGPRVTGAGTLRCGWGGYRSGPLPWQ